MQAPNQIALGILLAVCMGSCDERREETPIAEWKSLRTLDEQQYEDVKVRAIEPDALCIRHSKGTARIPWETLPVGLFQNLPPDALAKSGPGSDWIAQHKAAAAAEANAKREAAQHAADERATAQREAVQVKAAAELKAAVAAAQSVPWSRRFVIISHVYPDGAALAYPHTPGGAPGAAARAISQISGGVSFATKASTDYEHPMIIEGLSNIAVGDTWLGEMKRIGTTNRENTTLARWIVGEGASTRP